MLSSLWQLIAPSFCAACRIFLQDNAILCAACQMQIRPLIPYPLEVPPAHLMMVHAVGAYNQPLVSLIFTKNHSNRTVARQLGTLLWQQSIISQVPFDVIVPIPLHWTRYAWRGYNQAEEIGHVIAQASERPLIPLLQRMHRSHCKDNARNIFALRASTDAYRDKHLLLIDDVMIGGATLVQAAKVLWTLQPASITAAVIARVSTKSPA